MAELLERLATGPVVIFGHSLGGVIASSLAQRRPDLVAGVVLGDPPLYEGDPETRAASPVSAGFPDFVEQVRGWQSASVPATVLADEIGQWPGAEPGQLRRDQFAPGALHAWCEALLAFDTEAMDAAITGDLWTDFDPEGTLRCPALALRADHRLGPVFPPDQAAAWQAAVASTRTVEMPGLDHWLHVNRVGLTPCLAEVLAFVRSLNERTGS